MIQLTKQQIQSKPRIERLNLINSITGIKPANLIGTISPQGEPNLAIFSSVVHLGSDPAIIGFNVRPTGEVRRHTLENILATGWYTINHVHRSFIEKAHNTSIKFERGVSEFEKCGLGEEYLAGFRAPFVKESNLKMAMKFCEQHPISINDTCLIIGEVQHLILSESSMDQEGHIDLSVTKSVGISGLNSYYELKKLAQFPYARESELPAIQSNTDG